MSSYAKLLLLDTPKACDRQQDPCLLRERHLHALWAEQKWLKPLKTASGSSIEVVSPGIWNSGAGPDFLKAELKMDGNTVRGDIEIHLKDESWAQHGHNSDPRYNDVILHLSLYGESAPQTITKENGTSPSQAYLENALIVPPEQLVLLIDLDLYPYKEFLGSGTCAQTLFQELNAGAIETFFHEAALWRSSKKYEQLNFYVDDSAEILIAGVCQALGFKQNSAAFLQLYRYVQRLNIEDEKVMLATLMKLTGFFGEKYQKLWGNDLYYQELALLGEQETFRFPLSFQQIRPLNHPLRRLVYLSKFLTDPRRYFIQTELMSLWDAAETLEPVAGFSKKMNALIPSYTDSYFENRFFFGDATSKKRLGLIGEETKNEILLNSFIPFLQNTMKQSADQIKISVLVKSFPHRATGKYNYLTHRFFGQTEKNKILARGDLQQGAYQLHKDFCQHYESSCTGCPFVKRFKNIFNEKQ